MTTSLKKAIKDGCKKCIYKYIKKGQSPRYIFIELIKNNHLNLASEIYDKYGGEPVDNNTVVGNFINKIISQIDIIFLDNLLKIVYPFYLEGEDYYYDLKAIFDSVIVHGRLDLVNYMINWGVLDLVDPTHNIAVKDMLQELVGLTVQGAVLTLERDPNASLYNFMEIIYLFNEIDNNIDMEEERNISIEETENQVHGASIPYIYVFDMYKRFSAAKNFNKLVPEHRRRSTDRKHSYIADKKLPHNLIFDYL